MTFPDWQALALDIVLHSDERWQAQRDRIAQALNQAWSDGRRYQAQASTRESERRPARMPEEGISREQASRPCTACGLPYCLSPSEHRLGEWSPTEGF